MVDPTHIQVDPQELDAFATRFGDTLAPHFDRIRALLGEVTGLEDAMYTTVTRSMATVYTMVTEYTRSDVQGKTDDLDKFVDRLHATAAGWAGTEHNATGLFAPDK